MKKTASLCNSAAGLILPGCTAQRHTVQLPARWTSDIKTPKENTFSFRCLYAAYLLFCPHFSIIAAATR